MPYSFVEDHPECGSGEIGLVNDVTEKLVGCHESRQSALEQIAAIESGKSVMGEMSASDVLVSPQVNDMKDLDDKGTFGGYLNLFTGKDSPDLEQDFFTKDTDFWLNDGEGQTSVLYAHGTDPVLGTKRITTEPAKLVVKDAGVWMETQLQKRNQYEEYVQKLAKEGKLGLSSGTASHLVEREEVESKGNKSVSYIKQWPLGLDGTLTPTPAEPRLKVVPLKQVSNPTLKEIAKDILKGEEASEAKAMSMMDRIRMIRKDFKDMVSSSDNWRVTSSDVFDDFIIARDRETRKLFRVEYSGSTESGYNFQPRSEWTEVTQETRFVARSISKELDEMSNLVRDRNGSEASESVSSDTSKDVGTLLDELNQMAKG